MATPSTPSVPVEHGEAAFGGGADVAIAVEESARAERNMAAFRRLFDEGFGKGDLAVLDELVAPDMVEHQPGLRSGRAGLKGLIGYLRTAFPDLQYTIEDIMADGDKVWARLTGRGTHRGPFMGLPPTGKSMTIEVIDIGRFEDGRLVEHWGVPDRLGALEQLGGAPRPERAAS